MQFWYKHKFTQNWMLFRANAVSFEGCTANRVPLSGLEASIHCWRNLVKYNAGNIHNLQTLQIAGNKRLTFPDLFPERHLTLNKHHVTIGSTQDLASLPPFQPPTSLSHFGTGQEHLWGLVHEQGAFWTTACQGVSSMGEGSALDGDCSGLFSFVHDGWVNFFQG